MKNVRKKEKIGKIKNGKNKKIILKKCYLEKW